MMKDEYPENYEKLTENELNDIIREKIKDKEFDPKYGIKPLEWLDLDDCKRRTPYENSQNKMFQIFKEQPLIPIGLAVATYAVTAGVRNVGLDYERSQRLLRLRWASCAGVFFLSVMGMRNEVDIMPAIRKYYTRKKFQFSSIFGNKDEKEPVIEPRVKPVLQPQTP